LVRDLLDDLGASLALPVVGYLIELVEDDYRFLRV
jgi:hypothetical protein